MTHTPWYNQDADYNTNAKSYMDYLARHNKFMKVLVEDYEVFKEILIEEFKQFKLGTGETIESFQTRLDNIQQEMTDLFLVWLEDGTLEEIINVNIFNQKVDRSELELLNQEIQSALSDINQHRPIYVGYDEQPTEVLTDGSVYLQLGEPDTLIKEGTFDPNLISSNGPINLIHAVRSGRYYKIGDQVTVTMELELSSVGNSGDQGYLHIENLPFIPKYKQMVNIGEVRGYTNIIDMPPLAIQLFPDFINERGNSYAQIRIGSSENLNVTIMRIPQLTDTFRLITTFTYIAQGG